MLNQTPSKVTQCLEYAEDSQRRAWSASDPDLRRFWEKMERKWSAIAQTYSRIEQTQSLLAEFYFFSRISAETALSAPAPWAPTIMGPQRPSPG